VLSDAPMPTAAPTVACARLKWPLPRVVSATTSGTSTPSVAAEIPSSSCAATIARGSLTTAKIAPRSASAAKQATSSGRRPLRCAVRPTQGAIAATTPCGARMQIASTSVAVSGVRSVSIPAMMGSIAALASWNSTTAAAKIASARLRVTTASAARGAGDTACGTPPRASSGSISLGRTRASAASVGTPRPAVKKKIARFPN
jgi:hypothetical protein